MAKKYQGDVRVLRNLQAQSLAVNSVDILAFTGDLPLTFPSPANLFFYGTASGQIVTLGDATTYVRGHEYRVHNGATQDITVRDFGLTVLGIVKPGATVVIYLEDNSSPPGIWFFGRPNITSAPAIILPNFLCESSAAVLDLVRDDPTTDMKVLVVGSNLITEIPQGVLGVIIDKPAPTKANVLIRGLVSGYSGFVRNQPVFVGLDGKPTQTIPATDMVHRIGMAITSSILLYDPVIPLRRSN